VDRKSISIGGVVFVGVLLFFGFISFLITSNTTSDSRLTAKAEKRSFTIELNLIGILDAAQSHMISSNLEGMNGTIIYLVDDGKKVEKGELLVRLDRSAIEKEVNRFKAEVESYNAAVKAAEEVVAFEKNQVEKEIGNALYSQNVAELELKRLQEGEGPLKLSLLEEEQQKAQSDLKRYNSFYTDLLELEKQGYANPSELSSTKEKIAVFKAKLESVNKRYESYRKHVLPAAIESAKEKLHNASLTLQQTRQGGKHKIAKVKAALLQITGVLKTKQTSLDKALYKLSQTEIRAPFSGIVIHYSTFREGEKRKPREGDAVFVNQPILYLPDISKMVINSKTREVDLHKIRLGQRSKITVEAYPDRILTGELSFIGSLATADEKSGGFEKFFQLQFKVNEEDNRMRPGMTCRISIEADTINDVLSIPVQAVFTKNMETFCYVKKAGGFKSRTIVLGRRNNDFVEIVQGLEVGEIVSLVRQKL